MSASYIQVAPDSTGKKMQSFENTVSAQTVEAEAVVLVDSTGTPIDAFDISSTPANGDVGILTHAVIYGHSTAGGGAYVEVKANPSGTLTVEAAQGGTWTVQPGNTANTTAWKVDGSAVTQPVSIAATVPTKESRSATATTSQVADTATTTTLLASNANRLGATIENDSSAILYVKFGTTASATDYTVRMVQYAYFEVPFAYTGRIDGIWSSDPNDGAARITELT